MRRILLFALVGGAGFLVDAGVLALLLHVSPLGPFSARIVAIAAAMLVTFWLNRTFTFGRSDRGLAAEGTRYGGVGVSAALLNYAVYSAILLVFPAVWPVLAVAIASLAAMVWSFLGYSRFVFGASASSK
ncbi:GtrA family protein [Shinella zoogloeoides]|uniref:GtrA family protein n=1 Tax=Shinella zoogloeoides TaxID=352475 RepID=A0A6N8TJH7_SHIZO|nr:GtrA family protein [Shinella zoogloeoides]MXO01378.1 GtrA family protein [Shinella zoogloeoides]UEX81526.1 GtrA family protein [Shinella zoogloeoides]